MKENCKLADNFKINAGYFCAPVSTPSQEESTNVEQGTFFSYDYAKKNYQKLRTEAIKNGLKFSLFNFKKRKITDEQLSHIKFMRSKESKFYKIKKKWAGKLRRKLHHKLSSIITRCTIPSCHKYEYYGGKGIKCFLSINDIEFLWHRDNAASMKSPSIDRIDSAGNYTLDNCRFLEFIKNIKRRIYKKGWRTPYCKICKAPRYIKTKSALCYVHLRCIKRAHRSKKRGDEE